MKTLSREADKAEILGRLKAVRPDSAARWGRMSAHQMVCHLADWSRMLLGEKPTSPRSGLLERTLVKWFALYAPVRWPPGLTTSAELDQERGGTRPADFASDLAQAVALLERVTTPGPRLSGQPHPVFGAMSDGDWLRMAWLHTDHHLRQFGA